MQSFSQTHTHTCMIAPFQFPRVSCISIPLSLLSATLKPTSLMLPMIENSNP